MDPFILFMSPFLKPDSDERSRFQFAADNYSEVVKIYIDKVVAVGLTPVYQIFGSLTSAIGTAANGLNGTKAILGNMFGSFQSMVDIFVKRFGKVGNALTNTFRQLLQALQHVWATAVASLYSGLSVIYAMQNTLKLMITIVITILIILAVMIFFFFFALWPLLPLIILGGVMVGGVTEALNLPNDGAGAISSLACFDPETRIVLSDGTTVALRTIQPGDRVEGNGVVEGVLRFHEPTPLYSLHGVLVTGSHIVWKEDPLRRSGQEDPLRRSGQEDPLRRSGQEDPVFVQDHPDAVLVGSTSSVMCLLTSHRRIPVLSPSTRSILQFADWEELNDDDEPALQAWYESVDRMLNGKASSVLAPRSKEEAGCSGDTQVRTPEGSLPIRTIAPGARVLDAEGTPTRVSGVVVLQGGSKAVHRLSQGVATTGCWIQRGARWAQPPEDSSPHSESAWFHLLTESGTFQTEGGVVRDFSDVGADLPATYGDTLKALASSAKNRRP
jgi:hypothetical protein